MPYSVWLLTGSNEGDRLAQLQAADAMLQTQAGPIAMRSAVYETEAWGLEGLPPHYNQALQLKTGLEPYALLETIQGIENELGRIRQQKWGLRRIDIDIIYFEDFIIRRPRLCIPHPLLQDRRFVLTPITEIAPDFRHPILQKTNRELLARCNDPLSVAAIQPARWSSG